MTDKLSIEANSVDPEQTAPSSLIWVPTVCHRGFLNISADEKETTFVAIGAFRVNPYLASSKKHNKILKCFLLIFLGDLWVETFTVERTVKLK